MTASTPSGDGMAAPGDGDPGEAAETVGDDESTSAFEGGREIDRAPVGLSSVLAIAASAIAAVAASEGNTAGGALAGLGVVLIALGVLRGSRGAVHAAGLALLGGIVLGGSGDASELWILVATVAAVLAWDVGQNAIGLGEQLGRNADTARAELAHAAGTVTVGASTAGLAYVLYLFAGTNQPLSAIVVLLVAVAFLLGVLR